MLAVYAVVGSEMKTCGYGIMFLIVLCGIFGYESRMTMIKSMIIELNMRRRKEDIKYVMEIMPLIIVDGYDFELRSNKIVGNMENSL